MKRGIAFLAFAVAACAANASTVILDSAGTWATSQNGWTQDETVIQSVSTTAPLPELDTMHMDVNSFTNTAVATYTNTAGTDTLVLDLTITDEQNGNGNSFPFSMDGTWTYASGTGAYSSAFINSNSNGTFGNSSTGLDSGFSGTVLVGDLNPVPEPASIAALGIGMVGILRRRRKA